MSAEPCPACRRPAAQARGARGAGRRARRSTRSSSETITDVVAFFEDLKLDAARARDRRQDPQGDPRPAALPRQRRHRVPHARSRGAASLSGGESQRIRLATQIGSKLMGVLYVLDEPSIGLHQRDNRQAHRHARVDARPRQHRHRRRARRGDDPLGRLGRRPRPGRGAPRRAHRGRGAAGRLDRVPEPRSRRKYLSGERSIPIPATRAGAGSGKAIVVRGAREHNLKDIDVALSARRDDRGHRRVGLGQVDARQRHPATGRSSRALHGAAEKPGAHAKIEGMFEIDKVIDDRPGADRPHAALEPRDVHRTSSTRSASSCRARPRRGRAATSRGASPSTSRAGGARPARATARSRSRCTSCPTSTSRATCATGGATTARRWRSTTRASRSPTSWR